MNFVWIFNCTSPFYTLIKPHNVHVNTNYSFIMMNFCASFKTVLHPLFSLKTKNLLGLSPTNLSMLLVSCDGNSQGFKNHQSFETEENLQGQSYVASLWDVLRVMD